METITFEQLPQAIATLIEEVSELKKIVSEKSTTTEQKEKLLTVEEAAKFLDLTKTSIYIKVSKGELPVMKRGKRLYFSDIELVEYLKAGRKKTNEQTEKLLTIKEAAKFLDFTVPTVYAKVSRGELPVMKRGKRLYFSNIELVEYLKAGRKKTNAEINS